MNKSYLFPLIVSCMAFLCAAEIQAQELKSGLYPDGKLRYKGYFLDGQPAGEVTHYYPDGKIKAVMNHSGNEAEALLYSRDGNTCSSGKYIGRKKNGTWEYRKGERLLATEKYTENLLNGEAVRYYSDGKTAEIKEWKNGEPSGNWKLFYDNGKLRMEATLHNGKLDGKVKSYNYNGELLTEGEYRSDLKNGLWHFFDPENQTERQRKYHFGIAEDHEQAELEESRKLDSLINSGKKIPDPQVFADDPESYMKLIGE